MPKHILAWINQVERWFGLLTDRALRRALRRGVHRSVAELERDIRAFIDATDADPKPFRWVKSADDILAGVRRFCLRTLAAPPDAEALAGTSESGHWSSDSRATAAAGASPCSGHTARSCWRPATVSGSLQTPPGSLPASAGLALARRECQ
jgi:hypothetical protein